MQQREASSSDSALAARYRMQDRPDSKRLLFRLTHSGSVTSTDDGTGGESALDGSLPPQQPVAVAAAPVNLPPPPRKSSSFVRFHRTSFSQKNSMLPPPPTTTTTTSRPSPHLSIAEEEEAEEEDLGVSLRYLKTLPIPAEATFAEACDYVKQQITSKSGSFANHLLHSNPGVTGKATHFVSYAWSGGWGATMNALSDLFHDGGKDPLLWMDFAVVDQFAHHTATRNFDEWARTFETSLRAIGKAILVLTPAEQPIATSRAWCCYEWFTIVKSEIPFDYCVNPTDVLQLKRKIRSGQVGLNFFNSLFSKINVEYASAYDAGDAAKIQLALAQFGVVEVNDVVMMSVKEWLLGVVSSVQRETTTAGMEDEEDELAYILSARASLHKVLGELDLAEMYYSQAVAVCRKQKGKKSSYLAAALNNQALVLSQQGHFPASERLFSESLALQAARYGKLHPDYASALSNHAQLLSSQGEYAKAEQLLREALSIFNTSNKQQHELSIASCFNNLAGVLMSEGGKMSEAKHLYKEAIATWRRVLGNDHPQVATGLNNLSALYRETNLLDLASKLLDESLAIRKKIYGDEHHEIALCLNNLGMIRTLQGRFADAELAYRQAIAIDLDTFGEDGLPTLAGLNNLAQLYIQLKGQQKLEEAEDILSAVGEKRRKLLGAAHVDYACTLCDRGKVAMELGKSAEAQELLLKAIEIWKSSKQTKWLATAYNNLGLLEYRFHGNVDAAVQLFNKAIEIWKKFNGLDHPQVALGLANLGQACRSDAYFLEAIRILRLNPDNANNKRHEVQMQCTMSAIYLDLGELHKAERLLMGDLSKPGLELVTRRPAVFLRYVRARKADLLLAQNRLPQAIEAYTALLSSKEDDSNDRLGLYNQLAECYARANQLDLAERTLRTALNEGPGDAAATRLHLGNLLLQADKYEEALDMFVLAAEVTGEVQYKIATCYTRLGRHAEAEPHYRRVLDLSNNSQTASTAELAADFNNLAVCLSRQSKFKDAEQVAKCALELDEKASREHSGSGGGVLVGLDCFYLAQHIFDQADDDRLGEVKALAKRSLLALQSELGHDDENVQQVASFVKYLG